MSDRDWPVADIIKIFDLCVGCAGLPSYPVHRRPSFESKYGPSSPAASDTNSVRSDSPSLSNVPVAARQSLVNGHQTPPPLPPRAPIAPHGASHLPARGHTPPPLSGGDGGGMAPSGTGPQVSGQSVVASQQNTRGIFLLSLVSGKKFSSSFLLFMLVLNSACEKVTDLHQFIITFLILLLTSVCDYIPTLNWSGGRTLPLLVRSAPPDFVSLWNCESECCSFSSSTLTLHRNIYSHKLNWQSGVKRNTISLWKMRNIKVLEAAVWN